MKFTSETALVASTLVLASAGACHKISLTRKSKQSRKEEESKEATESSVTEEDLLPMAISIGLPANSSSTAEASVEDIAQVQLVANAVRRRVLEYTLHNNGGYLSQGCSSAETLATLYALTMKLGPSVLPLLPGPFHGSPGPQNHARTGEGHNGDPTDPSLDRLIFSPVHYALVLYSLLVELGRLDVKAFESYNKDGSTVELIGAEHSPGHAVTAGSLGQALSQAAGIAYARKKKAHSGRVFVFMSDGEFQEGQTWEALQGLVFHKIDNLVVLVDVNGQQCDGLMSSVMDMGNLSKKLEAFGAHVHNVDGHDIAAIDQACQVHHGHVGRPTFVLCHTDPCRGFEKLRERAPKLHYVRFKGSEEKAEWEKILNGMPIQHTKFSTQNAPPSKEPKLQPDGPGLREKRHHRHSSSTLPPRIHTHTSNNKVVVRPHRTNLVKWVRAHPEVIVLTADLTSSCEADLVRDELPDQFLSFGMTEQHMISFAGGLAREGFRPFIHTFGVFLTRRPFDQVAMSVGVPNLNVKLLGFLPGLTTPGGVTHQAIDDVALMRSIPNMRILECADATDVESVLDVAYEVDGPVYVRMLRGEVPRLFPLSEPMNFGVVRMLSEGLDLVIVTAGICTQEALKVAHVLKQAGIQVTHLHLSTISPFPTDVVVAAASDSRYGVITMENHSIVGGIGSATAEALSEACVGKRLVRLGVAGVYAHGASREYLMSEYGLDSVALAGAIGQLLDRTDLMDLLDEHNNKTKNHIPQHQASAEAQKMERPEDL